MSFAELQPSRRRGSEGTCCRSAAEQQRADAGPRKMDCGVVLYLQTSRSPFFIGVSEDRHEFCRAAALSKTRERRRLLPLCGTTAVFCGLTL